jgi:O-antigen/teichoic acid export membrane protein
VSARATLQPIWRRLAAAPRLGQVVSRGELAFLLARYAAVALVALEALAFARLLGPESYGYYALVIQLAALIPVFINPSTTGYIYAYYKDQAATLSAEYLSGALIYYAVVTALLFLAVLAFQPYLALSVLLFWIQALFFLTEPLLRVRNRFVLTTVGRGIGSIVTLVVLLVWLAASAQSSRQLDLPTAIGLMLAGNVLGYALYLGLLLRLAPLRLPRVEARALASLGTRLRGYWERILRHGLPLATFPVIYALFTYVDRLFIERFRPPEVLSSYALAWQLSQGGLILLTSLNVVAQVRIGEALARDATQLPRELRRQFLRMAAAGVFSFVGVVVAAAVLSMTVYADYAGLLLITTLIAGGYVAINVAGSVTHLLSYEKRLGVLCTSNLVLLAVAIAANALTLYHGLWYVVPIATSCAALIVMSVGLAWLASRLAARLAAEPG